MSETITIVLPGEPQGKARPRASIRQTRAGHQFIGVYTLNKTKLYERALQKVGRVAMRARPPLTGPLQVTVMAVMEPPSSWSQKKRLAALDGIVRPQVAPDWDNIAKTLDGLNGIAWVDDKQIVSGHVEKFYGLAPRLEVRIEPLSPKIFATPKP